ncbi:MAG: NAD(P)/FAD-dependent oxidoreductase [Halioglobus sp.]|nr:NAD(P)/FAD-dependent oxidoreductase [Halioglobus sp.]
MAQYELAQYDVIVLGAGAAGLFCAAVAAARGRRVLVLEKANKVGKKILMSGGGRCNFTNYSVTADNFISGNPHFSKSALSRYTQWDFIALVERYGIAYEERKHGQLFCLNSAADILAMLLDECEKYGVTIATRCDVRGVEAVSPEARYAVEYAQGTAGDNAVCRTTCHSLVVATGALSIPTLGGSGLGYEIAAQFSLPLTERRAGLVPFMFSDATKPLCERLSGISLEVEVKCRGQSFTENLLFTHRGISGPVILQISNYWYPGDAIAVNLLPALDCTQWLLEAKRAQGNILLRTLLQRELPKALVAELQTLWWLPEAERKLADFSDQRLRELASLLTDWKLKPSGTEGYRTAEVTLGGVDTAAISSKTMEARACKGLYFIGEVLDVSGHLGGYNFQWAWSSAFSAGQVV